ncbi:MAG TPA: BON domain-containing protein [Candidatus Binataceae bacterium]|nr:BON domain-containing protein [Candidatus Binataceae bacterium]
MLTKAQEAIVKHVRAALEREGRVDLHRHPLRIDLDSDGNLTLEGEVADVAAKKLGLEAAAAIPGVIGIIDRLRVAPVERAGDGAVRDHVRAAFIEESALGRYAVTVRAPGESAELRAAPGRGIEIAAEDGVVTLNGRVQSLSHKRLAGALAWWVPGVRDVVNGIEVEPPEEDSDAEITDAVRMVLEKDPLIDGEEIRVGTRDAVVTLAGIAANAQQRRAAENDAWCVFGVDKVINQLEVRQ